MRHALFFLFLFLMLMGLSAGHVDARQELQIPSATPPPGSALQIISPKPGQALQGSIPVVVDTTVENFQTVELTFRYTNDPTETWFLIYQGIQPVTGTMLVLWDTDAITDGDYILRMVVTFEDSNQKAITAPDLRVRNYTMVETNTPPPAPPTSTPAPPATPTPFARTTSAPLVTQFATEVAIQITPIPTNPAELNRSDILTGAGKGAIAVVGFFILIGIYHRIRSKGRNR